MLRYQMTTGDHKEPALANHPALYRCVGAGSCRAVADASDEPHAKAGTRHERWRYGGSGSQGLAPISQAILVAVRLCPSLVLQTIIALSIFGVDANW